MMLSYGKVIRKCYSHCIQKLHIILPTSKRMHTNIAINYKSKSNWFDRYFGIEIEMILPQQSLIQNHNDLHYHLNNIYDMNGNNIFNQWEIKKDLTLHIDEHNNDLLGFEIISPKLLYDKDTKSKIHNICTILCGSPLNAYLNVSCGFHVHCDANNINLQQTHQIAMNYNFFESIIDEYMNTSRRANNNTHCKSLNFLNDINYNHKQIGTCSNSMDKYLNPEGKNYKLNFTVLKKHMRINTIENRHHMGCMNPNEMLKWVKFNLLFIHQSLYYTDLKTKENNDYDLKTREKMLWMFINDDKLAKHFRNKVTYDDKWMLEKIHDEGVVKEQKQNSFINRFNVLWDWILRRL
eukprot:430022_1